MAINDTVAVNLRTLRDLRGLSQLELAGLVGVSRRTIARLEAAEIADPGVEQLSSLSEALGVTLDLLIGHRLVAVRIPVPADVHKALQSREGAKTLARMVHRASPPLK
jgi:transcriptional regulator with XRE-family HTH domain